VDLEYAITEPRNFHAVAIVGMGPKGLYCLERLLAECGVHPLDQPLHIHVFNRSGEFGASPIYDPNQPEYILVNISVGEIDLWTAEKPPAVGGRGLNFLDWYDKMFHPTTPLQGSEYLSRAVVGRYFMEGFHRLRDHIPQNVTLMCHEGEVVDIRAQQGGYSLSFIPICGPAVQIFADKVMLSTGHSQLSPGVEEEQYRDFANRHQGSLFIPFVYPIVETMLQIPAGARVAMKGIGLTFIDAVLELTEGRGGCFERLAQETLVYHASGKEPRSIMAFSRTGLPMTPKAMDLPQFDRPMRFLDQYAMVELRRLALHRKLDLEIDLWPLFEAEMDLQYYRVEMEDKNLKEQLEASGKDAVAMRRVIDSYFLAHPDKDRFDYRSVLDPGVTCSFKCGSQYSSFVEQYMQQEIERARRGQAGCGVKAAIDIWYEFRKVLGYFMKFGGFKPESHKKLMEYWFPRFKRVVFGPPIINIEKLLALSKAGILDFSAARNPVVSGNNTTGRFEIRCDQCSGASTQVDVLIDARYSSVNIERDAAPLYRNLNTRGTVRAYENRDAAVDECSYCPGAIDMTEGSHFVVDGIGKINEDIAVLGIPTEGNLVGNLTLERDDYAGAWATLVMGQLRTSERSWARR